MAASGEEWDHYIGRGEGVFAQFPQIRQQKVEESGLGGSGGMQGAGF